MTLLSSSSSSSSSSLVVVVEVVVVVVVVVVAAPSAPCPWTRRGRTQGPGGAPGRAVWPDGPGRRGGTHHAPRRRPGRWGRSSRTTRPRCGSAGPLRRGGRTARSRGRTVPRCRRAPGSCRACLAGGRPTPLRYPRARPRDLGVGLARRPAGSAAPRRRQPRRRPRRSGPSGRGQGLSCRSQRNPRLLTIKVLTKITTNNK